MYDEIMLAGLVAGALDENITDGDRLNALVRQIVSGSASRSRL